MNNGNVKKNRIMSKNMTSHKWSWVTNYCVYYLEIKATGDITMNVVAKKYLFKNGLKFLVIGFTITRRSGRND